MADAPKKPDTPSRGIPSQPTEPASGGINLNEIGRQVGETQKQVGNLGRAFNQLNRATQSSLKAISERVDALPCCLPGGGACPPAERTTATDVAPATALAEVGHVDEEGRAVITNPSVQRRTGRQEGDMAATVRERPVRDASDDDLADEILERRVRRQRRVQMQAELGGGIDINAGIDLQLPSANIRGTATGVEAARQQVQAGLNQVLAEREPWYKNKFFHTTWGVIILFLVVTFWDVIMGWVGYKPSAAANVPPQPQTQQSALNTPPQHRQGDPDYRGIINDCIDGQDRAYTVWRGDLDRRLREVYARITLARDKMTAVHGTANRGRLYPAESAYLDDAEQLLDEAAAILRGNTDVDRAEGGSQ